MAKIIEKETWVGVDFGEHQEKYGLPTQDYVRYLVVKCPTFPSHRF